MTSCAPLIKPFETAPAAEQAMILDFLKKTPLAVVSTISSTSLRPESALVAFAELETGELIFETFSTARKFHNLQANNNVSLVMGWDLQNYVTIQYEGTAHLLEGEERERCLQLFLQKDTPCTEAILRNPLAQLFKVSPKWLRYSDYSQRPPLMVEFGFGEEKSEVKRKLLKKAQFGDCSVYF